MYRSPHGKGKRIHLKSGKGRWEGNSKQRVHGFSLILSLILNPCQEWGRVCLLGSVILKGHESSLFCFPTIFKWGSYFLFPYFTSYENVDKKWWRANLRQQHCSQSREGRLKDAQEGCRIHSAWYHLSVIHEDISRMMPSFKILFYLRQLGLYVELLIKLVNIGRETNLRGNVEFHFGTYGLWSGERRVWKVSNLVYWEAWWTW